MAHVYTPGVQGELAPRSIRLALTQVMQLVQHILCNMRVLKVHVLSADGAGSRQHSSTSRRAQHSTCSKQ